MDLSVTSEQLTGLFTEFKQQFVVPLYQRPYSWTTEEVDQLWEDIAADMDVEHFMGSLVLNMEDKKRPEIIDGQQRLTTLTVLLALIRDRYYQAGSNVWSRPHSFLVADAFSTSVADHFKLRLGEANWEVYRDFVLRAPDDGGRRTWKEKATLPKKVQTDNGNLFDNAERLAELIDGLLGDTTGEVALARLEELERKVIEKLTFVVIRVGTVDDAFLLFETLNDRGLQLSAADLVKSHLLSKYEAKFGKPAVAEAHQEWQELIDSLAGADIGRFLRYFLLQYYEKVQSDLVFKRFKERLDKTSPDVMLTRLRTMARFYGEFTRPLLVDHGPTQAALRNIADLRARTAYVALLPARDVLADDMNEFARFARLTEALVYRWTTIVGNNAQKLEGIFQKAATEFVKHGRDGLDPARQFLLDAMPGRDEFLSAFRHKRMGTQYVARYTLRRIEEYLSRGSEVKTPDTVEIEHVMPQHLSAPWVETLGDEAVELHAGNVGRWGNLTLLSAKLNKESRDGSFSHKKSKYVEAEGPGSDIRMTQLIATEDSWGPAEIDNRQQWLGLIAEQLWGVPGVEGESLDVPSYPYYNPEEASDDLERLIADEETREIEFKSTARTNLYTKERDSKMEFSVGKTIAAFSNGYGGTLLIGIDDDGKTVGTEIDYALVKGKDRDGFLLWLTDYVKMNLDPVTASKLKVQVVERDGHDVWRVDVPPGGKPVFVKDGKNQRFFVRMNNATNELTGHDLLAFKESRWAAPTAE